MIPKTIHYCWFGRNPKPALAEKCLKSWKKYCKDYEIIEWNEDNFSIQDAPLYVRQAYEAKKWAFVSDYVRLYAMVNYGGIYMDTDVEVIKPLDTFLHHQAFSGFEDGIYVSTGIMACEKGFPLYNEFLHYYDSICFINPDSSMNTLTNVKTVTDICQKKGLIQNNTYQEVEGLALYPNDYFSPKSFNDGIVRITGNTYSIHHYDASWLSKESQANKKRRWKTKQKKARKKKRRAAIKRFVIGIIGEKNYNKIRKKKD